MLAAAGALREPHRHRDAARPGGSQVTPFAGGVVLFLKVFKGTFKLLWGGKALALYFKGIFIFFGVAKEEEKKQCYGSGPLEIQLVTSLAATVRQFGPSTSAGHAPCLDFGAFFFCSPFFVVSLLLFSRFLDVWTFRL